MGGTDCASNAPVWKRDQCPLCRALQLALPEDTMPPVQRGAKGDDVRSVGVFPPFALSVLPRSVTLRALGPAPRVGGVSDLAFPSGEGAGDGES
ncbi:hypothetical protein AAFF_G00273820 [Aldrovandia affinis]|uniref:Uncharacterized protein n=1 Tax=Aldrovandia affinis TaxID=143900 RepID=A0AAD7SRM3_9TELE|nr:hypothetical protein AAFF_G00273820 [Aldrovandia affinis]